MMLRRVSNQFLKSIFRNQIFPKRTSAEVVGTSFWFQSITTQSEKSTAGKNFRADGKLGDRVFASYSIFKGKAALSSEPVLPTFSKSDSGGFRVDRRGSIMLKFWPSVGERKYNWEKKQAFALSATEVGALINLGPHSSVEFFHDPSMKSSNAGQVRKSLSIKAQPDGSGYLFSLNVVNNILQTNERFVVPVTAAEFEVMRTAFSFALPHILGWDQYTNQPPQSVSGKPLQSALLMESEWDK
ncbi:hypothetical protein M9H77_00325 [Catharanthus roseus]|nr:hypothetical protein M9H77_00325 [Catharanthus roseus]